jgi:chitinase
VYVIDGVTTGLLANCHQIVEDIPLCQEAGKKIFLSLGGATPASGQVIDSEESAVDFANFLWGAFGPVDSEWTAQGLPRPFDDIVVDGFDFDIEWGTDFGTYPFFLSTSSPAKRSRLCLSGKPVAFAL